MASREEQIKSLARQIQELQKAFKDAKKTDQANPQPIGQSRQGNASSNSQPNRQHSKDRRQKNDKAFSVFKQAESHSSSAQKSSGHPGARGGSQSVGGPKHSGSHPHPASGHKEKTQASVRGRPRGPRDGQQGRQPQRVNNRSESVSVKNRFEHREQSEHHRRTPKFYGSQPNLLNCSGESTVENKTQGQPKPRGRQPFSRGTGRDNPQATRENHSQQHCKGPGSQTYDSGGKYKFTQKCKANQDPQHSRPPADQSGKSARRGQRKLDSQELLQLSDLDPSDIVMKLASPGSGLKEFLNQTDTHKNLIVTFLKILGSAFKCKSNRQNLHYLLELIKDSMFMKNILPAFVVSIQTEVIPEAHLENSVHLSSALNLLCELITVYPASAFLEVSLLATLVQSTSNHLQSVGIPVSEETETSLENLHQMVAFLQEKKRDGKLNSDTYTYFTGPTVEDFRLIPIYPTYDDIHLIDKPYVRPNIVSGKYPDTATYLDTHFRLLREDFVRPLRDGISKLLTYDREDLKKKQIDDIRIYFDAHVLGPLCTQSGVFYRVQFDKTLLKFVRWESSKRLLFGSLLCLSKDNFETMVFATVAHRSIEELSEGIITLSFTEGCRLQLVDIKSTDSFLMVETTAYFEAYRHVLIGLKEIRNNELPLQKYIVHCQTNVAEPKYLKCGCQNYTLKPLMEKQALKTPKRPSKTTSCDNMLNFNLSSSQNSDFDVRDFTKWPSKKELNLDESQMHAIQMALTNELVLVQGPPGTGKTFLGLKIIKVLLANMANMDIWQSPILVVCYTNHALDQFLEGIHTFLETGLVRVGGRSSSEILNKFSMRVLRREKDFRKNLPAYLRSMYPELFQERAEIQKRIEMLAASLAASGKGVLQMYILSKYIASIHLKSLQMGMVASEDSHSTRSEILEWLGVTSISRCCVTSEWTPEQTTEEDMEETDSSTTEGDTGNSDELTEEKEEDDDELIQVSEEAELLQAERMVEDDDLKNQIQRANARLAAIQEQFLSFTLKENVDQSNTQAESKDDGEWKVSRKMKKIMEAMVKKQLKLTDFMPEDEAKNIVNVWQLSQLDRWRLYRLWLSKYQTDTRRGMLQYEQQYERIVNRLAELRNQEELILLRQSKVVGMTTTGAAKYRKLLQDIQPKIVIVEEAAEVLEAHIITTLSSACEHLILIGDHQQLRPSATVYELAQSFNLEVSLFERLIRMNVQFVRLNYQHRMRPEIAELLTPHIYDKLENTQSVKLYENIKGISTNLYFIDHQKLEDQTKEGKSYQNSHEARFVKSLCEYFIQQEYKPSQITILTTYSGQLLCLKKMMPKNKFNGVKVCVVDKYQGEENDIVILSLVRSNLQGRVGFLRISNRICVALSRAKKGFYCIGNVNMLSNKVPLWDKIADVLRRKDNIGPTLRLCCQNHPGSDTLVSAAEDFKRAPEGGCSLPCDFRLSCGHVCSLACHPYDPQHKSYKCPKPCQERCEEGHVCLARCCEPCGKCQVKVTKVIPQCGHEQAVPCFLPPERFTCQEPCCKAIGCGHQCVRRCGEICTKNCPAKVKVTMRCGHERQVLCHLQNEAKQMGETLQCHTPCRRRLACGHSCMGACYECAGGRLHVACRSPCGERLPCSHRCGETCAGGECPPCSLACESWCPHGTCPRTCGEPCLPCGEPCAWACPHYRCSRLCHEPCDRKPCDRPCDRALQCGHPCIGLCGELCPSKCRVCHEEEVTEIFFGREDDADTRFLQLEDCSHIFAVSGFDDWMRQADADGTAAQLALCPKCSTPIRRNLRYGSVIKRTLAEVERAKAKLLGDEEELQSCKALLEQFLEEKMELSEYYLEEVLNLQLQLQESSTSPHKLAVLRHKISLLSKIAELKSKENELLEEQRLKIQEETELQAKWIMRSRVQFTDQELSDIQREISKLTYLIDVYLIQNSVQKQRKLFDLASQLMINELLQVLENGKEEYGGTWVQESIDRLKKKYPLMGVKPSVC
ncbi:NFX1-type zinc finger-containing protein 1-like [Heptranchias perlo]|uniref:NFX1-type zinc finger-containing protein 1-like n=1 Tax=Heptranchias perlo TaxID=212740 RepID=UPI00355980A1